MPSITIVQNDTRPSILATLVNAADLTGASAVFTMVDSSGNKKVDRAVCVVLPSTSQVRYDWQSGDTDTAGVYYGEFEVTYSDGKVQTFPAKDRDFKIVIRPQFG